MKVILSRKGFDCSNGGCASPIMPNGTMLSMPIPTNATHLSFDEISYYGKTYKEIWQELNPKIEKKNFCHLDPDIRSGVRNKYEFRWKAAFGQTGAALTHLKNQGVGIDDIFLFFGWFKEVDIDKKTGKYQYKKAAQDKHIIYGYMQIGEIITGDRIEEFSWHPHSEKDIYNVNSNALYISNKFLNFDNDKPGYGVFKYDESLVLTKENMSRTRWDLPEFFRELNITYHSKKSFKKGFFQSASIGQEFVIEEDRRVENWAKKLILNNQIV